MIGWPEDQPGLTLVCKTLIELAPHVSALEESPDWVKAALGEVKQLSDEISAAPLKVTPGRRVKHPLHGHITEFPIYAALWHQPKTIEDLNPIRRAQAVLLTAAALRPEAATSDYQSTVREAGLCVRRLCTNSAFLQIAQDALVKPANSLADIEANLRTCIDALPNTYPEASRHLLAMARLISYAREVSRPRIRTGEPTVQRHTRSQIEVEPDSAVEATEEFISVDTDASEQAERTRLGIAPIRESPSRRHASIALGSSGAFALSDRDRIVRAKTRARALATAAQRLPFASDRLQLLDLEALLEWLKDPKALSIPSDKSDEAVSILLIIMLLTGSDLQQGRRLQVANTPANINDSGDPCLVLNPLSWYLPVPQLDDAFQPTADAVYLYRPTVDHLILPVLQTFPGVDRLLQLAARIHAGDLFTGTDKHWAQKTNAILKHINHRLGSRLTLHCIADFLPRIVTDLVDDRAEGSLFSHVEDSTGSAARLYYYAPRMTRLVSIYRSVWNSLPIARSLEWSWSWNELPASAEGSSIGSAGCPLDDAVTQMVNAVKTRTIALSRGRRGLDRGVQFHNQLTAYTALMAMWTAALRAVKDPIEVELIDAVQGLLAVSEKESDNYSTSRVIPLPEVTLIQLVKYSEHRDAFLEKMDRSGLHLEPKTWLFFVTKSKPVTVTPSNLWYQIGDEYQLHRNAQRHYLRTRLRELGVPGSYVDALLGHGAAGEEPYGRYSCMSPMILARYIREPLSQLVNDMGWQPIHGYSE